MSAEHDKKATELVLKVLTLPVISKIKFTISTTVKTKPVLINTRTISPALYSDVAKAITDKKITIIVLPTSLPAGVAAMYFDTLTLSKDIEFYDVIVLRHWELGRTVTEQFHSASAIVHECTHAGMDALKFAKMSHLEHECASYVAGALFAAHSVVGMKGDVKKINMTDTIFKEAWDIALLELEGKPVPQSKYDALHNAIRINPQYKATVDKPVNNNGVGKPWKLKGTTVK